MSEAALCIVEGCGRDAAPRSALCWCHLWRRRKGKSLDAPRRPHGQTPHERVLAAVDAYLDCGDDPADLVRWHKRFNGALRAYAVAFAAARHPGRPEDREALHPRRRR